MKNFIYAFNERDKALLLQQGFSILKEDIPPYIFKNDEGKIFSFDEMKIIFKDEMLF